MKSKYLSLFTALLGSCIFSTSASAEYYIIYSPPEDLTVTSTTRVIHHAGYHPSLPAKHYRLSHRTHRRHGSYNISITYLGSSIYPDNPCSSLAPSYHLCNHYQPAPVPHHMVSSYGSDYYARVYEPYDNDNESHDTYLDMRTGDDNDYNFLQ